MRRPQGPRANAGWRCPSRRPSRPRLRRATVAATARVLCARGEAGTRRSSGRSAGARGRARLHPRPTPPRSGESPRLHTDAVPLAAILTIGNELLSGDVENTNARWLARRLERAGVEVGLIAVVPDAIERIAAFLAD